MTRSPSVAEFFSGYIKRKLSIAAVLIVFIIISLGFGKLFGDSDEAPPPPTLSQIAEKSKPAAGTGGICQGPPLSVEEREVATYRGSEVHPTLHCITNESYELIQREDAAVKTP